MRATYIYYVRDNYKYEYSEKILLLVKSIVFVSVGNFHSQLK